MLKFRTYHIQYDDFFNSLKIWWILEFFCFHKMALYRSKSDFLKSKFYQKNCTENSLADNQRLMLDRRSQNCGIAWGHVSFTPLKAGKAYRLRLPKRCDWQVESAALLTLQGPQFAALQGCFPRRLPCL
jgi:hypothetical protein